MKHLATLSLLFILATGFAQNFVNEQSRWVQSISQFRDSLLLKNPKSIEELTQLMSKWDSLNVRREEQEQLIFNVLRRCIGKEYTNKYFIKKVKKWKPELASVQNLTEVDVGIIKDNAALLDLILLELIKPEFPFNIDPKTDFFQELAEYDIKESDKIAEIGAGLGAFSFIMNRLFPKISLFINEIDRASINYIELKKFADKEGNPKLITGNKKSTMLEEEELDKIIIRESFHHFSKPEEMLASIRVSLKQNGLLFLFESVKELDKNNDICPKALHKVDLIKSIELYGFRLIKETQLDEQVLLRFSVN